jgi:hypothetical protein
MFGRQQDKVGARPLLVTNVTLDPGSWSLDNYGQLLVATVRNGATYTWNPATAGALDIRAAVVANAPTTSLMSLVSDRDRHLFLMGTLDNLSDSTSQNKMFIRFSNQEDINTWQPTATNTAGTFLLTKEMKSLQPFKVRIMS